MHGELVPPTEPYVIKWLLPFDCCLAHSSVMIRRAVFGQLGGYSPDALHAEDYDLWVRLSLETQFQIANLPKKLLCLRRNIPSVSSRYWQIQNQETIKIMQRAISTTLGERVPLEVAVSIRHMVGGFPVNGQHVMQIRDLIVKLYRLYSSTLHGATTKVIARDVADKFFTLVRLGKGISLRCALSTLAETARLDPSVFPRRVLKIRRKPGGP